MLHKLFGSSNKNEKTLENRLIEEMAQVIVGLGEESLSQARSQAKTLLNTTKQELENDNEAEIYREGGGDNILSMASTNKELQEYLNELYILGVREKDFRDWHNLSRLEQRFLNTQDKVFMSVMHNLLQKDGYTEEKTFELIRAAYPTYTADIDQIDRYDQDTFLPVELRLRVNEYRRWCVSQHPQRYDQELADASSYNAWVREKISTGQM